MLVGHDPLFTRLAGYLLGAPELQIDFKKGAILRVDFDGFGPQPRGMLRWFLSRTGYAACQRSAPSVGAKHG